MTIKFGPRPFAFNKDLGAYSDGARGAPLANENCYGYRLEMSAYRYRDKGAMRFAPHNGNGQMRFPGDHHTHTYHYFTGHAHTALTRALWELNPVSEGDGGTLFVNGSHKAAFSAEDSLRDKDSPPQLASRLMALSKMIVLWKLHRFTRRTIRIRADPA